MFITAAPTHFVLAQVSPVPPAYHYVFDAELRKHSLVLKLLNFHAVFVDLHSGLKIVALLSRTLCPFAVPGDFTSGSLHQAAAVIHVAQGDRKFQAFLI